MGPGFQECPHDRRVPVYLARERVRGGYLDLSAVVVVAVDEAQAYAPRDDGEVRLVGHGARMASGYDTTELTRYLVSMRIGRIVEPARRHGVPDADIWHAYRNALTGFERGELLMLIGPGRDGDLLEVGILGVQGTDPVIVHAMKMRPRFRKYL